MILLDQSTAQADAIRAQFPILSREINGRPLTYLDSAASAQKPEAVISAMAGAMRSSYANVHRGLHTLANETTAAYEDARQTVASFLGAETNEIVFTRGSTEGLNLIASSLGSELTEGDEIVLSVMEHHSNIVPWHFLRERHGVVLRWVDVTEDGALDMESYAQALSSRTKIVAVTHMSNVLGTVTDAARIAHMAHDVNALVVFDGSQSAVHVPRVDVKALGADFYVVTGHKLYGPTGIGALYGRHELLERIRPYQGGGEMIASVAKDAITYNEPPYKFEAGTPPILEAIGLGAALTWLTGLDREAGAAHEDQLAAALTTRLKERGARILGEADGKGAVVSFVTDGAHPHDLAQIMDQMGVAIRAGQHCAEPLMQRFGVTASARASFGLYNNMNDVEACLAAFDKAKVMLG